MRPSGTEPACSWRPCLRMVSYRGGRKQHAPRSDRWRSNPLLDKWTALHKTQNISTTRNGNYKQNRKRSQCLLSYVWQRRCFILMSLICPSIYFHPFIIILLYFPYVSIVMEFVLKDLSYQLDTFQKVEIFRTHSSFGMFAVSCQCRWRQAGQEVTQENLVNCQNVAISNFKRNYCNWPTLTHLFNIIKTVNDKSFITIRKLNCLTAP